MDNATICQTRFPLFMVHGTGFRDYKLVGYWGRIPKALEENGATLFYGQQDCWGTVEENAATLKENLLALIEENQLEKVNILAHSKGGLEARYLASVLGCAPYIASITTIATPHGGSKTMDKLVKLPKPLIRISGFFINCWYRMMGDKNPDFYTTCHQFTSEYTDQFNRNVQDVPGIYYQSVATVMKKPASDFFLWFPNLIVGLTDEENDGLLTLASVSRWPDTRIWRGSGLRGISHVDSIDLRRHPFSKKANSEGISDITTAYVRLVSELAQDGF